MDKGKIEIRRALISDIDSIENLYMDFMFDSYLSKFGCRFVRCYLEKIINSKRCITLVAEDSSICGFIMASFDSQRLFLNLSLDLKLVLLWFFKVLANLKLFSVSLDLLSYQRLTKIENCNAEFLFITVKPEYRRRGIGNELIRAVLKILKTETIDIIKVTSLKNNKVVNELLGNMGFQYKKEFILFGKHMVLWYYMLKFTED